LKQMSVEEHLAFNNDAIDKYYSMKL